MVWRKNALRDHCDWEPEERFRTPWWVPMTAAIAATMVLAFTLWWVNRLRRKNRLDAPCSSPSARCFS